jgi:hypothetical protein
MKKWEWLNNRRILIVVIFVLPFSAFLAVDSISTKTSAVRTIQNPTIQVATLAQNIEAVAVKENESGVQLSLRNGYDKPITAFVVSPGGSHFIITEFIGTDKLIAPGASYVQEYTLPTQVDKPNQTSIREHVITVLAVVFEDKTGEGNTNIIKGILDKRSAEKLQIDRILPLLTGLLRASEENVRGSLETARVRLGELPEKKEETDSSDVRSGLHNVKERALRQINELEELRKERGDAMFLSALRLMKEQYEQKRAKL